MTDLAAGASNLLEIDGLYASYGSVRALEDVTVSVAAGELLGVIGPNGAGKSTLLRAVVGLVTPDAGVVRTVGGSGGDVSRRVAFVPQQASVDPDFPIIVRDLVAMGRVPHLGRWRRPGARDAERVADAMAGLGLEDLADRAIGELSGGQRQRAFVARALAQEAELLLMDEPFAGVDVVTERVLWEMLGHLRDAGGAAVVVGHDIAGVAAHCDRLLLLNRRVVACGPASVAAAPEKLLAAYGGIVARPGE